MGSQLDRKLPFQKYNFKKEPEKTEEEALEMDHGPGPGK